jgi:hypothetical protein
MGTQTAEPTQAITLRHDADRLEAFLAEDPR